jgi:hypothetical protein
MDKCFPLMKALAEICPEDFRKKTGLIDIFDQEIGQHLQQLDRILWWIFSEKTQFWILMKLEYVDFLNEWQLGIVSRFVDMETSNIAMKLSSNILLMMLMMMEKNEVFCLLSAFQLQVTPLQYTSLFSLIHSLITSNTSHLLVSSQKRTSSSYYLQNIQILLSSK